MRKKDKVLLPSMTSESTYLFEMHVMQGKTMKMNLFLSNFIRENPFLLPIVPLKTLFISIRSPLIKECHHINYGIHMLRI